MNQRKKYLDTQSQSALEYLMTYGWAILIIVIVAGVLYSLGIFSPGNLVATTITGFSGISVTAAAANSSIFEFQIVNAAGDLAVISSAYLIYNGANYSSFACTAYSLSPAQSTTCEILNGDFGSQNKIAANINIQYSISNVFNTVSFSQGNIVLQSQSGNLGVTVKPDVYVANPASNIITAISGTVVLYNLSVGAFPTEIAYNPSNGYIYVTNSNGGTVSIINDTTTVATVYTGTQPDGVLYDPANDYVYVTNRNSNTTSVISGTTVIQNISGFAFPGFPTYDPYNQYVYVTNDVGLSVTPVSIISGLGIIASAHALSDQDGAVFNPSNNNVYVSNWGSGVVSDISGTQNAKNISSCSAISGGTYDTQDGLMYFGSSSGTVCILNSTSTLKSVSYSGGNWGYIPVYDPGDSYIYNFIGQLNETSIFSGQATIKNSTAFDWPLAGVYESSSRYMYIANNHGKSVTVMKGLTQIKNISIGSPLTL